MLKRFITVKTIFKILFVALVLSLITGCSTKFDYVAKPIKDIKTAKSTVEEFLFTQYHRPSRPVSFQFTDRYMSIAMGMTVSTIKMSSWGQHVFFNNNTYRIYYDNIKGLMLAEKNGHYWVEPVCIKKCYKLRYYSNSKEDAEFFYDSFSAVINNYKINGSNRRN